MPKMKSHRGAAKRFSTTGTGKIRRRRAYMNHMLGKKSSKHKRHLNSAGAVVAPSDRKKIRRLIGG